MMENIGYRPRSKEKLQPTFMASFLFLFLFLITKKVGGRDWKETGGLKKK